MGGGRGVGNWRPLDGVIGCSGTALVDECIGGYGVELCVSIISNVVDNEGKGMAARELTILRIR